MLSGDWSSAYDGRTAEFYTELRPMHEGKRVAFRVMADSADSLSWIAFDRADKVLETGSAQIRAR